jgi:hypothetical protein
MSDCNSKEIPKVQETIQVKLPGSPATDPITINGDIGAPFYYASISSFWIYLEADPIVLRRLMKGTGLQPFIHNKRGLVNFNFQNYSAHNGAPPVSATDEFEFNIVAYPESRKSDAPKMSHHCFMMGEDQTKLFGNYRVHVPCNNRFAIAAGEALFGENKFFGHFEYAVPSPNAPKNKTWKYTITDSDDADAPMIMDVDADFQTLVPIVANPSAIIDYSMLKGRLIGSRRNIFSAVNHYILKRTDAKKIKIKVGPSKKANMAKDLAAVLKNSKIIATQVIQTPPVIAESRAYYI